MPCEYPKRPKFFSHRFCRLMGKVCLGGDIGPEACWLLAYVVHTEDAGGYRRPITFYNEDLSTRTGFSISAMMRARQRAVEAGWLSYDPGKKRKPATYFVTVPEWAQGLDDAPGDEGFHSQIDRESGEQPVSNRGDCGEKPVRKRGDSGEEAVGSRGHCEHPSTLSQDSLPLSLVLTLPLSQEEEPGPTATEFMEAWNSLGEPFPRILKMNSDRLKAFASRKRDSFWVENWRSAIAFIPESSFLRGESPGKWIADADFFLRPNTVQKIMEGKYSDGAGRNGSFKAEVRDSMQEFLNRGNGDDQD